MRVMEDPDLTVQRDCKREENVAQNKTRRTTLAKSLLDLSRNIVLVGLIALIFDKLDWMIGIALSIVAIVSGLSGFYVLPGEEAE